MTVNVVSQTNYHNFHPLTPNISAKNLQSYGKQSFGNSASTNAAGSDKQSITTETILKTLGAIAGTCLAVALFALVLKK